MHPHGSPAQMATGLSAIHNRDTFLASPLQKTGIVMVKLYTNHRVHL